VIGFFLTAWTRYDGLWVFTDFSFAASEHAWTGRRMRCGTGLRDNLLDWLAEINLEPLLARDLKLAWVES
jgi:hypothetical protein